MERSVYDITLDLQRNCSIPEVIVQRGDTHRTLRFFLADGGKPYALTNIRAVLTAQKPDGSHLFNECAVVDGRICYELTSQTTSCPGQVECQLRLYGENDALLTTAAFTLTVEDTVYTQGDEAIESTDEATTLTKLMTEAGEKLSRLDAVLAEKSKQYELIESITLDQAVTSIIRQTDPDGTPYNFSGVRIFINAPAAAAKSNVIINCATKSHSNWLYHGQNAALNTEARYTYFKAQNDKGMLDYNCVNSNRDTAAAPTVRANYSCKFWDNLVKITIQAISTEFPVGTVINIYAIRG